MNLSRISTSLFLKFSQPSHNLNMSLCLLSILSLQSGQSSMRILIQSAIAIFNLASDNLRETWT